MTKILSDKYPLLLILHLARLSCSCDLVMCTYTSQCEEKSRTEKMGSNPDLSHEKQKDGEITELNNDKTTSTTEEALPLNAINDINMQTEETLI